MAKRKSLLDTYQFPGFYPKATIKGIFGDPQARILRLARRQNKQRAAGVRPRTGVSTISKFRPMRNLACGEMRLYLEVEVRRVQCHGWGKVKQEKRLLVGTRGK